MAYMTSRSIPLSRKSRTVLRVDITYRLHRGRRLRQLDSHVMKIRRFTYDAYVTVCMILEMRNIKMKRKGTRTAPKFRCPFGAKNIENLLSGRNMSVPILEIPQSIVFMVREDEIDEPIFSKPVGKLLDLSEKLGNIILNLSDDQSNYHTILRDWSIAFMHGILEYRKNDLRPELPDDNFYVDIFDQYAGVFKRAFVAEDVDDDNYEDLEFLGDASYRAALTYQLIVEQGVKNKAYCTHLRHHFENTAALSNLARIFHMEPLIRSNGAKPTESLTEDVFESILGAFQILECEILRQPGTPVFDLLCANNGFTHRLVRMVFDCTTHDMDVKVPAKTFMTGFSFLFTVGGEKINIIDNMREFKIAFATSPPVVALIARTFQVDAARLGKILNASYSMLDGGGNDKRFSHKVYTDTVNALMSIGITQSAVQMHKNMREVPSIFHERMNTIGQTAVAKGYWLGINFPKNIQTRAEKIVRGVFYHAARNKPTPAIEMGLGDNQLASYDDFFARLERLVERLSQIEVRSHINLENNIIATKVPLSLGSSLAAQGARFTSVRQPPKTRWAHVAAKSVMTIGAEKKVPTAGKNETSTALVTQAHKNTLPEALLSFYVDWRKFNGDTAVFSFNEFLSHAKDGRETAWLNEKLISHQHVRVLDLTETNMTLYMFSRDRMCGVFGAPREKMRGYMETRGWKWKTGSLSQTGGVTWDDEHWNGERHYEPIHMILMLQHATRSSELSGKQAYITRLELMTREAEKGER